MGVFQLYKEQKVNASLDEIWEFISSPKNLQKITPDYMGFQITNPALPENMYPGMIISYKVSPILGIKMNWVTEITHVSKGSYFVDEQRSGPYKMWHHEHWLEEIEGGVIMRDRVTYIPPLGILGKIANYIFIKKQLEDIFEFRKNKMNELFNSLS